MSFKKAQLRPYTELLRKGGKPSYRMPCVRHPRLAIASARFLLSERRMEMEGIELLDSCGSKAKLESKPSTLSLLGALEPLS